MFVECLSLPRFSPSSECWFYKDRIIRKEYISFLFPRELRLIVPLISFLFFFEEEC